MKRDNITGSHYPSLLGLFNQNLHLQYDIVKCVLKNRTAVFVNSLGKMQLFLLLSDVMIVQ